MEEKENRENFSLKPPLVSIVVLTYNHYFYIEKALNSILSQKTSFSYEILIGDDASSDGTTEIVQAYARKYPEIIFAAVRSKNIGATRNLCDLFMRCRGKYIASCEGDDFWTDSNKLEKQINFLEDNTEYIACTHDIILVDQQDKMLSEQKLNWISSVRNYTFSDFKGVMLPGHPVSLVFRNIFLNGISPQIIEEIDTTIADRTIAVMLSTRGNIYRLPEIMAAYRKCTSKKDSNATARIYTDGQSCLIDYRINEELEKYAESILQKSVSFTGRRWTIVIKATLKAVLRPSFGSQKYLKTLYKCHVDWLKRKNRRFKI